MKLACARLHSTCWSSQTQGFPNLTKEDLSHVLYNVIRLGVRQNDGEENAKSIGKWDYGQLRTNRVITWVLPPPSLTVG